MALAPPPAKVAACVDFHDTQVGPRQREEDPVPHLRNKSKSLLPDLEAASIWKQIHFHDALVRTVISHAIRVVPRPDY